MDSRGGLSGAAARTGKKNIRIHKKDKKNNGYIAFLKNKNNKGMFRESRLLELYRPYGNIIEASN